MKQMDKKQHWENIYQTKELNEVSWYQPKPATSLNFFEELTIPKNAKIIDIGGGDSFLVDHLIDLGYSEITVLDISEAAIQKAKNRLGNKAEKVTWIVSDIVEFQPTEKYDVWHDRAAFHFLTNKEEREKYVLIADQSLNYNGILIVGTFSVNGPFKCSGIEITQYSEESMLDQFKSKFEKVNCFTIDHTTPFNTIQNFLFCSFKKSNI